MGRWGRCSRGLCRSLWGVGGASHNLSEAGVSSWIPRRPPVEMVYVERVLECRAKFASLCGIARSVGQSVALGQQSGCLVVGLIVSCSQLGTFPFPFRCLGVYDLESCYNLDMQLVTGCTQLRTAASHQNRGRGRLCSKLGMEWLLQLLILNRALEENDVPIL
jgi:hypothetical protein